MGLLLIAGCSKPGAQSSPEQNTQAVATGEAVSVEEQQIAQNVNDLNDLDTISADSEQNINLDELDNLTQ